MHTGQSMVTLVSIASVCIYIYGILLTLLSMNLQPFNHTFTVESASQGGSQLIRSSQGEVSPGCLFPRVLFRITATPALSLQTALRKQWSYVGLGIVANFLNRFDFDS